MSKMQEQLFDDVKINPQQGYTQSNWSCSAATSKRAPGSIGHYVTGASERSQQSCSFK